MTGLEKLKQLFKDHQWVFVSTEAAKAFENNVMNYVEEMVRFDDLSNFSDDFQKTVMNIEKKLAKGL